MSTNDDELISADLEALLGGDEMKPATKPKKAPPKKAAAAKAPEPETETEEEKSSESLAEIEARIRAQVEAEVREKVLAEQQSATPVEPPPVALGDEIMPPAVKKVPEGHVLIHIVEDGFTYGEKVLYRGQELTVDPEDQPWVRYDGKTQINIWGKRYFREGHWDGSGFDLNDPALTEAEKNRLRALASQSV